MRERLQGILGEEVIHLSRLSGGCVGEVYKAVTVGGAVVVKVDESPTPKLDVEAMMLQRLAERSALPVPAVLHVEPGLLVMEMLPGRSVFSEAAQRHAAELLAELHSHGAPAFGFDQDTLIGGLHQANPWTDSWIEFFAEHRLRAMGRACLEAGRIDVALFERLSRLASELEKVLEEPAQPALIHGDVWSGNVLSDGAQITGFLDPAIYYAHPEVELAFITLFSTFGEAFFQRYDELCGIEPGFERRREVYNLFPLLVHARLFGGGYVQSLTGSILTIESHLARQ